MEGHGGKEGGWEWRTVGVVVCGMRVAGGKDGDWLKDRKQGWGVLVGAEREDKK